ncbi:polyprenyl synthetase family protein [Gephyromycinifex aptenodytis]|uniref:polyprenyl synthetase family protein n=1 Tax=Gephyromycinifex aptenodytis TaxID=2716227 RepID=UPI0014450920|nr:polyprenyl synthetase family protein [Gephyromycinifex aptenodytis]
MSGGARIPETDPELEKALGDGLAQVDSFLRQRVDYDDPFIAEAGGHLLGAGGKRFRPLLCLMAAQAGKGTNADVIAAASAVELTHLASLYHDDVMDEADLRRGVVSANVAYGNSTAILVGDLLFGTASAVMAELGPEAVRIQAETFMRLCAGQIRDDRPCPPGVDPVEYYLGVLRDKTGVLIATAARYGAMFSGCDAATVETLREYGELLGVAFQLADDLLDIASVSGVSGKTPGTDLREGVETLPILMLRSAADPADAELLELLDRDLRHDDESHARALAGLRAHPALQQAREYTLGVARQAQARLEPLGDTAVARALHAMTMGVVDRAV